MALLKDTRSDNIARGMPLQPLDSTHSWISLGVTGHHNPSTTHMIEKRQAWHDIISLEMHTRSDKFRHGMPSWPQKSTHSRTISSVQCHYRPWIAPTDGLCRVWHAIFTGGQHIWSEEIGHAIPSLPLNKTHGRIMSCVICHHNPWRAHIFRRLQSGMPS